MAQLPQAVVNQRNRVNAIIEEQKLRSNATPIEPPVDEAVPPQEVIEVPIVPVVDWEHKFKTIEGMWKAEKKQWTTEKDSILAELNQLRASVKAVNDSRPIVDLKSILSQDEIDGRDESELNVLAKVAEEAAKKAVDKARDEFQTEFAPIREELANTKASAAARVTENFWTTLSRICPDWEQINADDRWKTWLAQVDRVSKKTRQSILDEHSNALDAASVADVFEAFRETLPKPRNKGSVVPDPVTPPVSAPTKEFVKASDIRKFYSASARGEYKSRPTEYKELKEKYDRAYSEGRVVHG